MKINKIIQYRKKNNKLLLNKKRMKNKKIKRKYRKDKKNYNISFMSRTGVPFNMSTPLNLITFPSISVILIVETPIGFGLLGA